MQPRMLFLCCLGAVLGAQLQKDSMVGESGDDAAAHLWPRPGRTGPRRPGAAARPLLRRGARPGPRKVHQLASTAASSSYVNPNGFRDMNGGQVPFGKENFEHSMLQRFVRPDAAVLEIGARYGTSTCVLSRVLHNSGKQVCVEPDHDVWSSLQKNLERNQCNARIFEGAVGMTEKKKDKTRNGSEWTTHFSLIQTISYQQLEEQFKLKFDTFVVDCEGCFDQFLKDFPDSVDDVTTILLEADYGVGWQRQGNADYQRVISFLQSKGFSIKHQDIMQDSPYEENGKIMYFVFTK